MNADAEVKDVIGNVGEFTMKASNGVMLGKWAAVQWVCPGDGCEEPITASAIDVPELVGNVIGGSGDSATCPKCGQRTRIRKSLLVHHNQGPNRHQRRAARHG